ncbi:MULTISPECIES: ScbA/BarX family gamma-butyrolactone biosynthesis protein [unclassified Streptomyces]|uniref:ScbA/BarX family gamma-butyrolactone biosynthesis protein n=1 Tax=unclassified Streptomyces TaxID=2593676 RepID=UPI0036F5BCDF
MSSTAQVVPDGRVGMPVTREYVHKVDASEVLLTQWRETAPDAYRVLADWPRDHRFYGTRDGLHDPLLFAETVRQTVPLLSHAAYGVPFGHRQSWSSLRFSLTPAALAAGEGDTPLELRIDCRDVVRRAGRLATVTMQVEMVRDGVTVGHAQTHFANHAPALYERVRGRYADLAWATGRAVPPAPPVAPERVGRDRPGDVVLSASDVPGRSRLRVDMSHPVLFDHPVDHVPGMLVLEAARQAAHSLAHPEPVTVVGMDAVFARYGEFDAPCWVHASLLDSPGRTTSRAIVSLVQNDLCLFSGVVTMLRTPRG